MIRRAGWAFLAWAVVAMTGCGVLGRYPLGLARPDGGASRADSSAVSLTVTEADSNTTVRLPVGGRLDVVLAGNPTTGYNWEVAAVDSAVLAQVGEALFEPDTEALGSGGRVTCRFVGVAAGQTELRLVHRRPWEKDVAPTASFAVTVVVAPAGP